MKTLFLLRAALCLVTIHTGVMCVPAENISTGNSFWNVRYTGSQVSASPSPEATAMRRYQDYPVSYASGTADITIPLFELPAGDATLSLGLGYHTGAIKRDEPPTDIGLGWSLTGLGMISRQINGYPDEGANDDLGEFHNRTPVCFRLDPHTTDWKYMYMVMTGACDTDYDLFSYSVPGYSGHFIIRNDTTEYGIVRHRIKLLPESDVNIDVHVIKKGKMNTYTFFLTTPDGIQYTFDRPDIISRTTSTTPSRYDLFAYTDYIAESCWHPTYIRDNKTRGDTLRITYRQGEGWKRDASCTATSQAYMIYPDMNFHGYYEYKTEYELRSNVVRSSSTVTSQTGWIPWKISGRAGSVLFRGGTRTAGLVCRDPDGNTVREIAFDNSAGHEDGRRRLDGVTVRSGGVTVDSYRFTYHRSVSQGCDLFGYSNGSDHMYSSVLGPDMEWEGRVPSPYSVHSGSLMTISDISGVTTTLEYEPADYKFGSRHPLFGYSTYIGHRLHRIRTECAVTGRTRIRTFSYGRPQCNMDLSVLDYSDFITQSGTYETVDLAGNFRYSFGVTHTPSPTTCGVTLENAVIYYGQVTEEVTGTGLAEPVRTLREYDTDPMRHMFMQAHRTGPCMYSAAIRNDRFLGLYSQYYSNTLQGYDSRPLQFAFSRGYYQHRAGAEPLLRCRTDYEYSGGTYVPRREQRCFYTEAGREILYVGAHCESVVMKQLTPNIIHELGIDCAGDMNCYFTTLYASRYVSDSTVTTTYYPDGRSRRICTRYISRGDMVPECPGFEYDTCRLTPSTITFRPVGTRISCGDESVTDMTLSSWFSKDRCLRDAAYDRYTRTLPEVVKRVYRTAAGSDSVHHRYFYRYGISFQIYLDRETFETGDYAGEDTLTASRQVYHRYDLNCRPDSLTDRHGIRTSLRWRDDCGQLSEMTLPDAGLTTRYTYSPLVGCTSVTLPSGHGRRFVYTAGRLSEITNAAGQKLHEYTYRLYGDGTPGNKANSISHKAISSMRTAVPPVRRQRSPEQVPEPYGPPDSVPVEPVDTASVEPDIPGPDIPDPDDISGNGAYGPSGAHYSASVTATYYDGFGLPVQTAGHVAGGSYACSTLEYDALDRPVRRYLPVPAGDDGYVNDFPATAAGYYGDSRPFSQLTYRTTADDRPVQVLREGEAMREHPERYEYLCNSETDGMLRCRRYRLADRRDSESVTLDGYYPAGALDVTRTTGPDSCTLLTFTDWRGFVILERRVVSDHTFADTYRLYDVLGNVRVIIQPEGAALMTREGKTWTRSDTEMERYAFVSRYDRRGNQVYTKVPGAGAVEMRYDPLNRPAFRQTAAMRERGETEFTLYDPIGRVAVTGISYGEMPAADSVPVMTAAYNSSDGGIGGTGYPAPEGLVLHDASVTSASYYDSYGFLDMPGYDTLPDNPLMKYLFGGNGSDGNGAGQLTGSRIAVFSGNEDGTCPVSPVYACYRYDADGNMTEATESTAVPGTFLNTERNYSTQGILLNETHRVITPDTAYHISRHFTYDSAGFLTGESLTDGSGSGKGLTDSKKYIAAVSYTYDRLGRLESRTGSGRCKTVCGYNLRGEMTSVTSPAFSQTLGYDDGMNPCYNGNISQMTVSYGSGSPVTRQFSYDGLSRLTAMESSDGFSTSYSYTLNSAPLSITRRGPMSDGTAGQVDDLSVEYDGNRPVRVTDSSDPVLLESSLDFAAGEARCSYDCDGRLIRDTGRGISITYSPADCPAVITTDGGTRFLYSYDATGRRHSRRRVTGGPTAGPTAARHYIGPYEFDEQEGRLTLHRISVPWGYITAGREAMTYITDHQGNIRAVTDSTGTAVQTTDCYPYGLPMATSTGQEKNPYKYSGKELETEDGLDLYDFGARQYYPAIAMFDRPDPMAGDYPHLSPYMYCAANPVMLIDPTGRDIWKINEKGEVVEWKETKEYDRFEFVDKDNNIIKNEQGEEQVLQFEYGTVSHKKETYNNVKSGNHGDISGQYDLFTVKGDRNGTELFEMFSNNVTAKSGNEIGLIRTGELGKGTNYVTSAQVKSSEPGGPTLFHNRLKNGYFVREITHSHHDIISASKNDRLSHQQILRYYSHSNKIRFKIFISKENFYIQYDPLKK